MGGSSKQKQTSTQSPYAPAQPGIQKVIDEATKNYDQGIGAQVYQGDRVAGMTTPQQQAINGMTAMGQAGQSDVTLAGANYVRDQLGSNGINPYVEKSIANSQNDAANQIASRFSGAGRYGSGAAQTAIASKVDQIGNDTRMQAYDTQQSRNVGLLGQLQNLEQLRQDPNKLLLQAGTLQQVQDQGQLDAAQQKFSEQQAAPRDALNNYAGIIDAQGGMGGTNISVSRTSANPVQQIIGGIMGGLGQAGNAAKGASSIASLFALSDKRAKTNIAKVGSIGKGLNVYNYNLKATGENQTGLLAQEVEKKMPEAVKAIGGVKHVAYGMVGRKLAQRAKGMR